MKNNKDILQLIIAAIMVIFANAAHAQENYIKDLAELFGKFSDLIAKVERASPTNVASVIELQTLAVELLPKLGQLSQEAAKRNLALLKSGEKNNKRLLLISSSADSLLLADNLLLRYIYTNEAIFIDQSNAAVAIARALQQSIK